MVEDTTTVQVSYEIWAALDRRKEQGETFDDLIRRLINATGVEVGALEGPHPDVEYGEFEEFDGDQGDIPGCAHYDVVDGETCKNPVTWKQRYKFTNKWDWFYYCDEHGPE